MTTKLTPRQRDILEYIAAEVEENGYPPSIQEIGVHFGIASTNGVHDHLSALERKDYIERSPKARSIRLTQKAMATLFRSNANTLPLVGVIAAGQPLLAIENIEEYVTVSPQIAQRNAFCLRVRGDSMIEAGILEGDVIIVDRDRPPRPGSIVVALVDNEATVKRWFPQKSGTVELHPANARFKPMRYPAKEVQVQGVVTGLQRNLA